MCASILGSHLLLPCMSPARKGDVFGTTNWIPFSYKDPIPRTRNRRHRSSEHSSVLGRKSIGRGPSFSSIILRVMLCDNSLCAAMLPNVPVNLILSLSCCTNDTEMVSILLPE